MDIGEVLTAFWLGHNCKVLSLPQFIIIMEELKMFFVGVVIGLIIAFICRLIEGKI